MTKDEAMQMALDALQENWRSDKGDLAIEALRTALATSESDEVLAEREACAKVCDDEMDWGMISPPMAVAAGNCADLIRARGNDAA